MTLIICTSHLYIPTTLSIMNGNYNSFCIYTDRTSIATFFGALYPGMDVFLLDRTQDKSLIGHFSIVRAQKKAMRKYFNSKAIYKVVFFHEGYCTEANWLIKYLWKKKKSEVVYMPVERTFDQSHNWEESYSIKNTVKKLYTYLFWQHWIHYYKYMNDVYPIMDKSFYKTVHCKEIETDIISINVLPEIDKKLLPSNIFPYSGIIWLENTARVFKIQWNEQSYCVFVKESLPRIGLDNVFFKGHPDKAIKYGEESKLNEIPSYIPGNLLLKRFSCFVGVISDLMFEAAIAGTLTISTIYLFDMDKRDREMLVDYLRNRSKDIKFPKTTDEFIALIRTCI